MRQVLVLCYRYFMHNKDSKNIRVPRTSKRGSQICFCYARHVFLSILFGIFSIYLLSGLYCGLYYVLQIVK